MSKKLRLYMVVLLLFWIPLVSEAQYDLHFHQAFVPPNYVAVMRRHIETIGQRGWGKIGQEDLYHGHLMLKRSEPPLPQPLATERLFEGSVGVLYHTDEHLIRWAEDSGLSLEKRRPRSLVGYWDGSVVTAASLFQNVAKSTRHYESHGSVHLDELATEQPDKFANWRGYQLKGTGGRSCYVNLIIDIYHSTLHRPMIDLGDGKKYAVTMDCRATPWL